MLPDALVQPASSVLLLVAIITLLPCVVVLLVPISNYAPAVFVLCSLVQVAIVPPVFLVLSPAFGASSHFRAFDGFLTPPLVAILLAFVVPKFHAVWLQNLLPVAFVQSLSYEIRIHFDLSFSLYFYSVNIELVLFESRMGTGMILLHLVHLGKRLIE